MLSNMSGTQRYALFVLVVVVVVVAYLLVSGGIDELTGGDDEPQTSTQSAAESAETVSAAVALGETDRVGAIDVTIQSMAFPERIRAEGIWRSPAERFAEVRLTVTNRSKQAVFLPIDGLQLVTSDGRAYLADAALSLGTARYAESVSYAPPLTLQPLLTVTVIAVFDIPLDASGLTLRVSGGWTDFALFE